MLLETLTSSDIKALDPESVVIFLPVGSTEGHGSHLPLATDVYTAYGVGRELAKVASVLVAPPIYYGLCRSSAHLPGTVSIKGTTLRTLVLDILEGFYLQGFKKFLVFSGHAGGTHVAYLVDAAEEFLKNFSDVRIAVVSIMDVIRECAADLIETQNDSHAGEWETSMLEFFHPELIREGREVEYPKFPKYLIVKDKERYWKTGVWGDPTKASRRKGEELVKRLVERLCSLLETL